MKTFTEAEALMRAERALRQYQRQLTTTEALTIFGARLFLRDRAAAARTLAERLSAATHKENEE